MERTCRSYEALTAVLLAVAVAACSNFPFGPSARVLPTLSLSVGQRVDIWPAGVGYDSLPDLSSSALYNLARPIVAFRGMERVALYNPGGGSQQLQVFHFAAMATGQSVVTLSGAATVQETINVLAAVPHGAFAQVNAGNFLNTCAVTTRGAGFCWGGQAPNAEDGVGDEATPFYSTPGPVPGGLTFAAISSPGGSHTCGLTTDGAAYCWGENFRGQLGTGNTIASTSPVPVTGGLTFTVVSAGIDHTCGVTTSRAAYCWGSNYGNTPVAVSGGLTFASVGAGYEDACGLTTAGAAYCWGDNEYGELGIGNTTFSTTPVAVTGGLTFVQLSTGYWSVCGLTVDGQAYCWGYNGYGELGTGTTTRSLTPVAVAGGLTFATISASSNLTCGVTTRAVVYCWGWTRLPVPTAVAGSEGLNFAALSVGYLHVCGVTTGGTAYCWGDNSEGELGDGSTTGHATPVPVFGP